MSRSYLYYPDIFYFKTTFRDQVVDLRVNYENITQVSNQDVKGKLLQAILLYDSVLIEAWDLPVVVHFFNGRENAERIAESGLIKVINADAKFLACSRNQSKYTLSAGSFMRGTFTDEDQINEILRSFRGNYNDYKDISRSIYKNSIALNTDELFEKLQKEIELDISNPGFRRRHRIQTQKLYDILPQDISYLNARLEAYRRIYLAQSLEANNIMAEDILMEAILEKTINDQIRSHLIPNANK